jgi:hypothetical protein
MAWIGPSLVVGDITKRVVIDDRLRNKRVPKAR